MKFVNQPPHKNVNVSSENSLKVFVNLLVSLCVICFFVYLSLIAATELVITLIPDQMNKILNPFVQQKIQKILISEEHNKNRDAIQVILNDLVKKSSVSSLTFQVNILETEEKNAFAFPGGQIAITTGLLQDIQYENELVMLLAHELGHYQYNDHLRALGRSVILGGMVLILNIGGGGDMGNFILRTINLYDLKYSRTQESRADFFALDLMNKYYRHVTGSIKFLEKLKMNKEELWTANGYLSTHPLTEKRIESVRALIKTKNYRVDNNLLTKKILFENNSE